MFYNGHLMYVYFLSFLFFYYEAVKNFQLFDYSNHSEKHA